ncbi:hypothetical protein RCC30_20155 [Pseudomonas fluorescens]|nr:hypothetical protein RCC30_20155 [Pseudomonas fluorescens]
MSTRNNGLALQRMHWVGLLAAILVWVLGVTEVGGNASIWFFKTDEMLAALLYAFAENSPQLLDPFVEGALLALKHGSRQWSLGCSSFWISCPFCFRPTCSG